MPRYNWASYLRTSGLRVIASALTTSTTSIRRYFSDLHKWSMRHCALAPDSSFPQGEALVTRNNEQLRSNTKRSAGQLKLEPDIHWRFSTIAKSARGSHRMNFQEKDAAWRAVKGLC